MCKVDIIEILTSADYPEAGEKLYQQIEYCMQSGQKTEIDLKGVDSLPSMFLNVSIGRAIDVYGIDAVKGNLIFYNITTTQVERLKEYMGHFAKRKI